TIHSSFSASGAVERCNVRKIRAIVHLARTCRPGKLAHDKERRGGSMAKVTIEQAHTLPHDEVKKRLQELADRLSAKYGIDARWVSDTEAAVKRIGVSGKITCL